METKEKFSNKVSPELFVRYDTAINMGAFGGKLMGAGGSGFFYF